MEWEENHLKLFICHIHSQRTLAATLKTELADYGIDAFVAHDDIHPSRAWQDEIEVALRTCDALAALLHDGFKESDWTDQEVGHCLARGVKIIPLRFDLNPYGFISRYQAAACTDSEPSQVAEVISAALLDDARTRVHAEDGLIEALVRASSFREANARAERLRRITDWTQDRLDRLKEAQKNDQVAGAWTAKTILDQLLPEAATEEREAPF